MTPDGSGHGRIVATVVTDATPLPSERGDHDRLTSLGPLHVLDLRHDGAAAETDADTRWYAAADLGLPTATLRLALSADEMIRLALPRFLAAVATRPGAGAGADAGEIVFVHPDVTITAPLAFGQPLGDHALELFAVVPGGIATRKSSPAAAREAGAGEPTGRLLRLAPSSALTAILRVWQAEIERVYVTEPTASLEAVERAHLGALPALHRAVRWNHDDVLAHWSDLGRGDPVPAALDVSGLAVYAVATGPALEVIARRSHAGDVITRLGDAIAGHLDGPGGSEVVALGDGRVATEHLRHLVRALDPWGTRWPDPATPELLAWLEQADSRGLRRWAQALYWSRPDLQASFPADATAVTAFEHWLRGAGVVLTRAASSRDAPAGSSPKRRAAANAVVAPPAAATPVTIAAARARAVGGAAARAVARKLRPDAVTTLASGRETPSRIDGVNVVGYARAESGLGEAMRGTVAALDALGVPMSVLDVGHRIYSRQSAPLPPVAEAGTPHDVTIFHLNPLELTGYAADTLAHRFTGSRHIGFWAWETEQLPASWVPGLDVVDEVWVPSRFVADAVAAHTTKPVIVMGHPVQAPAEVTPARDDYGLSPEAFVVGYVTDAFSGLERKEPAAAITAFADAFGDGAHDAHLLLKVGNLASFPALRADLLARSEGLPVTLIGDTLPRAEVWRLLASLDAYLSLHASEGFGLTILEAMALGVPVVATRYGGSLDFTSDASARLIGFERVPARGGPGDIYTGAGMWARPNVQQAAAALRALADDPASAEALATAGQQAATAFTPDAYRQRLAARLHDLGLPN